MSTHRANKYPAPCCQCDNKRVRALYCVDTEYFDDYGTMTLAPRCYCAEHCPCAECTKRREAAAKAAKAATQAKGVAA